MLHPIARDPRYTITPEGDKYALRFNGELVETSISRASLVVRAVGHRAVANGATVIEGKPEASV